MNAEQIPAYHFTAINAGPDWLTATQRRGLDGRAFREVSDAILDEERVAGGDVLPATLRDYAGLRGRGFFVGARRHDRIIVVSGQRCPALFARVAQASGNVSRLDLQVSVWTHGETPELAQEAYRHLKSLPPSRGRPRNLTLIQSHPTGETLNVGKRQSDAYGRVYDWASAHKAGEAKTVWRYEVELKRHLARDGAASLLAASCQATHTSSRVHSWFKVRGLDPTWTNDGFSASQSPVITEPVRDVLGWFEASVSKTIAKAVNRYGIERVLLALGLSDKVQPILRRSMTDGIKPTRLV